MGRYIIKPVKDEDFYVEYSTVVDSPVAWGTREQFEERGEKAERMNRADTHGTTSLIGEYKWEEMEIEIREGVFDPNAPTEPAYSLLPRHQLKAFCEAWPDDSRDPHPLAHLLIWHNYED